MKEDLVHEYREDRDVADMAEKDGMKPASVIPCDEVPLVVEEGESAAHVQQHAASTP